MSEDKEKKIGSKFENPESIPTAGGTRLGEEHEGESKMIAENARSESVTESGHADDMQRELEGKKPIDKPAEGGEEDKGMLAKVQEKLGMGKKE